MKNNNHGIYSLLTNAYYSTGGFCDGGYLTQHPRESKEKYSMRRKLAYYLNYIAPCVNAHVNPVFKTLAVRDWRGLGSDIWERFFTDVDFTGTSINNLMKQAALNAKLHGIAYIVMDKLNNEAEELRLKDLADRNNLPYAYVLDVNNVKEVEVDKFGRITKFVFIEQDAYEETRTAERTMTVNGWTLSDSKGNHSGKWDIGCVPVVAVASKAMNKVNPFPPSEFLSIVKTNLNIYNLCSWLNDILANQTFSVLTYPSNNESEIQLGTNNALVYSPESSHAPSFIAPSAEPANTLIQQIALLQQEIYRMAVVVNVTGSNRQQSGEAKAWDYEATNQTLSDFADIIEAAELKLAELFKRWVGVEFEYTVNYPNDFKVSELLQELQNAEIALGLNFGERFNKEVLKRVLTSYFPEITSKQFDELVEDYTEKQKQLIEALEYGQQTINEDNIED